MRRTKHVLEREDKSEWMEYKPPARACWWSDQTGMFNAVCTPSHGVGVVKQHVSND